MVVPWRLIPTDTFLALVCGREIAQHGLPSVDTLAVVTQGHVWTDQQWLGQLAIYGVDRAGGLRAALLLQALVIVCTFALCARHALLRGASPAATLVCGIAGFGVGAASFTLRPQMFSLLAFAALLVLLSETKTPSRRVFLTLPILVVWANVHGAVVLGAMLVALRGMFEVAAHKTLRGLALAALAACTPFCTPYARGLPRYFHDIGRLQDPARDLPILEWNRVAWPGDWPFFAIFAVMLGLFIVVHLTTAGKVHRPPLFETLVVALTALGSWQATRHLQWFGLALAAYAPLALDAVPAIREGRVLGLVSSAMRVLGPLALVVALVRLLVMKEDDLERSYPRGVLPMLERETSEHADWHLASSDHFADWALWNVPALRGRIEADVRFELLDDDQARAMMRFLFARRGWESVYPDAAMVLVSRKSHEDLDRKLEAMPGMHMLWESPVGHLFVRM